MLTYLLKCKCNKKLQKKKNFWKKKFQKKHLFFPQIIIIFVA